MRDIGQAYDQPSWRKGEPAVMQERGAGDIRGVDVSHWQGHPDWARVREQGIAFCYIKATEGTSFKDPVFLRNAASARAKGLAAGFYHYAHPEQNEPAAEIKHFLDTVQGIPSELPHVLNVEGRAGDIGAARLTRWVDTWLSQVSAAAGKPVMLYAPAGFAERYFGKELAAYPLWAAHYGAARPKSNRVWSAWTAFQYSDQGKVAGIAGPVDLNVMDADAFARYTNPDSVTVLVGGSLTIRGRLLENRVWVPARAAGEALGGTVDWTGQAAAVNGKVLNTRLFGPHAYVRLLQLAAALEVQVSWDGSTRTAALG